MSAISPKIIAQARSYDPSVFSTLVESIAPRTYSISLLESLLTHFQMEKLPKATSYSAIHSLFEAKPMVQIMACLVISLDSCYYTETLLQSTADKIHDCIEGILSWTLLFVNHIFSPKSKHCFERRKIVGDMACLLMIRLLRFDIRIDQLVTESQKTFEIALKPWPICDVVTEKFPSVLLGLILKDHMNKAETAFEKHHFVTYLVSDEARLGGFVRGFVSHLTRARERLENAEAGDQAVLHKVQDALNLLAGIQNRLSSVRLVYRALRQVGVLQSWVKTLAACLARPGNNTDTVHLVANTLRMSYQPHASPLCGLQTVIEAGIHDLMLQCIKTVQKYNIPATAQLLSSELYGYFLRVYSHFSNHPRGVKLLEPIVMSLGLVKDRSEFSIDAFRTRVDLLQRMDEAPHLFTLCDNESHGSMIKDEKALVVKGKGPEGVASCSNCHSVFYCDPICQKEDWTRRHKSQCSAMRSRYIVNDSHNIEFSYRYRVFSAHLVLAALNNIGNSKTAFTQVALQGRDPSSYLEKLASCDTVTTVLSNMCLKPTIAFTPRETFTSNFCASEPCPVTAKRIRDMSETVAEKGKNGGKSTLVAATVTGVPRYHFALIMEVEKDVASGNFVCLQHVASIQ
ncbi:hypothetical protein CC1G_09072 [Coprinopsis cinerea okayama7|uniref:MYND-type domain-containing protein n=1 Tax=Coprinopsis cinerea (strain Okayama-7 / 130 / ATCC MYA-4618 / FGSC 9003) TaxID=240176 RepID=A8P311_COPC7|nr:hypothetical protein CC1G_09072 [Coprinopsis cinerea okayama7\|eukprot:XP_001838444.2 hypothetical protein CC1G_09072 [Coprinopsis cinerea okayama7\